MGIAFGTLNAISFVASLLVPYVSGWIKDATGSFAAACYLAAVVGLAGIPVALAVGRESPVGPASRIRGV
jgi:hypothetical protein